MGSWAFPSPKKSKPTNAHSDNLPFAVSPDKNVPQSRKAYLQCIHAAVCVILHGSALLLSKSTVLYAILEEPRQLHLHDVK
eukprot:6909669-Ditylum_brightwellii.AAC.1